MIQDRDREVLNEDMIQAGVAAMAGYDPDYVTRSEVVQDIFSAMWESYLQSLSQAQAQRPLPDLSDPLKPLVLEHHTPDLQGYPLVFANTIINKKAQSGGIEHMKLHKLLFYAYGWGLVFFKEQIMNGKPEVWRYGPVFSSVYWNFSKHKNAPITQPEPLTPFSTEIPLITDEKQLKLIDWVLQRYGHFDSMTLSDMTHAPGTPWQIVAANHDYKVPKNLAIDDEITRSYFKSLAERDGIRLN